MKMFVQLIGFVFFMSGAAAAAEPEPSHSRCDGAPPNAVVDLPAPINQWLSISCSVYGHALVGTDTTNWWTERLQRSGVFPAQCHMPFQEEPNLYFFTTIEVTKLDRDTANEEERKGVDDRADTWRLLATTSMGNTIRLYFVWLRGNDSGLDVVFEFGPGCGIRPRSGRNYVVFRREVPASHWKR